MNKKIVLAVVAVGFVLAASAFAARIAWKSTDEPPVSLRLALTLAEEGLKAEDTTYYCLSAGFTGRWEFHFGSKTGKEMWVAVGGEREISKSKDPFEH